jgi:hypothetical protein
MQILLVCDVYQLQGMHCHTCVTLLGIQCTQASLHVHMSHIFVMCLCCVHRFHDLGLSGDWYGTLEWQDPGDRQRRKTINVLKVRGILQSQSQIALQIALSSLSVTKLRMHGSCNVEACNAMLRRHMHFCGRHAQHVQLAAAGCCLKRLGRLEGEQRISTRAVQCQRERACCVYQRPEQRGCNH